MMDCLVVECDKDVGQEKVSVEKFILLVDLYNFLSIR